MRSNMNWKFGSVGQAKGLLSHVASDTVVSLHFMRS